MGRKSRILFIIILIICSACAEKIKKYTQTYDKVKYDLTFKDIKQIVDAFTSFKDSYGYLPKISKLTDLKTYETESMSFIPYFLKTSVSLRDSWGEYIFLKMDPDNPSNYWIASSGGDKKFSGFEQIINIDPSKNSDDIIYYNGKLIYSPITHIPKKK